MDETSADATAQTIWSWGQAIAGLFVAVIGIIAGAYADSTGRRMPWLWAASIVFIFCAWMLWYMVPDGSTIWSSLIIFSIAFIAAELALVFTNAVLPSLGEQNDVGKISGNGAALGYTGGILSLFIMLFFFFDDGGKTFIGLEPGFGLLDPDKREGTRAVGPLISIWFIIFMVPYFLWVQENKNPNREGGFGQSMKELKASLLGMLKRPSLFSFMGAQMFYRDALNGLYAFGGVYAVLVLDWGLTQLGIFGILGGVSAALVTWISGKYDRKLGPKPVIYFHVWVLIVVSLCIIGMSRTSFYGIVLPDGSSLPDIIFYVCGAAIGGSGGGVYAASRSMMVRHTNPNRPTEAFGLFALAGKATAFLAPLLIGVFTYLLNDARLGFSPVIGLFILGLILMRWVHPKGDQTD